MPQLDPQKKALTRVTCGKHIVPYLRDEVEALGFDVQDEDHAGIHIGATFVECTRLNLQLRTAFHVMWLLKRFRCPSPKALYTHASSFPWEELIPVDSYFSITSSVDNPKINNTMYPNLVLKDAIVDRMVKVHGRRPDSGSDRSKIVINLYWKGDRAWIYLNTSGNRLADRTYRKIPHRAPMQETLAAATLLAAGYNGSKPLANPMCGAGTLAIEAALIATKRAPGLIRTNYSFMHTLLHHDDAWQNIRKQAHQTTISKNIPAIVASDHDPRALDAARKNAMTAGVEHLIEFVECDFSHSPICQTPGLVILNPEYGERIGDIEALDETYAHIGDYFKKKCPGWTGAVFTGNMKLAKRVGLRPSKRILFMNAQIDCRLLLYEMYEGSRKKTPDSDESSAQ